MSTPVVMPQMGESIAEGTIVRWIKKVGDSVDRDEPLFEISTDKVDAEIPSPAAGTLLEITVKEGETVAVNSVVATIGAAGEVAAPSAKPAPAAAAAAAATPPPATNVPAAPQADGSPSKLQAAPEPAPPPDSHPHRTSPLVRRIAKEHGVDLNRLTGSGIAGRVTKQDILSYIEQGKREPAAPSTPSIPSIPSIPSPSAPSLPSAP